MKGLYPQILFCVVYFVARTAEARATAHARAPPHSESGVLKLQNSLTSECGVDRSPLQRSIDKAYVLQKHKLDRHRLRLTEKDYGHWDTKESWHIWELFAPIYNCPTKEKLGNQPDDGGKFVCGVDSLLQYPDCMVLSFGSNGEPSFENSILQRTPCTIHTFDPTLDDAKRANMAAYPDIHLHEYGLGAADTTENIAGFNAQVKTLPSIMEELGIEWIDLLKIDIEGGEWKALQNIIEHFPGTLPFTQLQIELHFETHYGINPGLALQIMSQLEAGGMRVFSLEYNFLGGDRLAGYLEYSMINVKDCRTLV